MFKIFINALLFQIGWFVSVLYGNLAAAAILASAILIYSLFYLRSYQELVLIGLVVVTGYLGDMVLGITQVVSYPAHKWFPPFWMFTLWVLFAMTLPWSLKWLVRRKGLFILFCAVGGSASYYFGVNLSAVEFGLVESKAVSIFILLWVMHGFVIYHYSKITHLSEKVK